MNGRSIFVLLALSLSPVGVAACGEDPAPQKSSTLKLDGTYRPTEQGAIGSITFTNDKDYVLVPDGCGASDCQDIGTYRLDAETSTVYLESAATHRTKTIVLEKIKTSDAARSLIQSFVRTKGDLIDPGTQLTDQQQKVVDQQQQATDQQSKATDKQSQATDQQQKMIEQVTQLIKTIIEAAMNGQGMKKDDDKKDDEKKADDKKDEKKEEPAPPPADPNDPNAPKP